MIDHRSDTIQIHKTVYLTRPIGTKTNTNTYLFDRSVLCDQLDMRLIYTLPREKW